MELSKPLRLSNGLCSFSPNGLYIAVANQQRLTIYSTSKRDQSIVFTCTEVIQCLEWSVDSELILTSYPSKGKLEVWSVYRANWKCRISAGPLGVSTVCFAPTSRHVLTISCLYLRLTIWSLLDRTVCHINLPKEGNPSLDFSPGGTHMAVVERRTAKDCIGIYSCDSWTQITLIISEAIDIGGLRWSPDGIKLAVWDSLYSGKSFIYSITGEKIAQLDIFGLQEIHWSPSAQIIAASTIGSKIKLVSHLTWQTIATLVHTNKVQDSNCVVFQEKVNHKMKYHIVTDRPVVLAETPNGTATPSGHLRITFSCDARYVAAVDDHHPKVIWIWDVLRLVVKSIIIQAQAVKCLIWSPTEPRLAIGCGTNAIYFWTPLGCAILHVTSTDDLAHYNVDNIQWNINGATILISNKDVAYACEIK